LRLERARPARGSRSRGCDSGQRARAEAAYRSRKKIFGHGRQWTIIIGEDRADLKSSHISERRTLTPKTPAAFEALGRIQTGMRSHRDDAFLGAGFHDHGYYYWAVYGKDGEYPLVQRRKNQPDAAAEIVLDVPKLAKGHKQFILSNWLVSPDGALIAYAIDFTGGNQFQIFIRSIVTGKIIGKGIESIADDFVFSSDNRFLFYRGSDENGGCACGDTRSGPISRPTQWPTKRPMILLD
jgi:hypothetical protein